MMRLIFIGLVATVIGSCADGHVAGGKDRDSSVPGPTAVADTAREPERVPEPPEVRGWEVHPPLDDAPPMLAIDTIPPRADDGSPVRYGIESARLFGRFEGDARGTRTVVFDRWGLRERKEEIIAPFPETRSVALNNVIFITTPTTQAYADMRTKRGFTRSVDALGQYRADPRSRTMSLGAWLAQRSGAQRLADTTISGYRTRVYRRDLNGVRTTIWSWRGLTLRELVEEPAKKVRYWFEPLELQTDVATTDSTFEFPAGYLIAPYE